MTSAITNYGTLLKQNGVTIAEVVSIDPPTITNPIMEATNLSSGAWREYIPMGLKEMSEMSVTMNLVNSAVASGIMASVEAGTNASYALVFPNTHTQTFTAVPVSYKIESVNAQSPEAAKFTLVLKPTGSLVRS